MRVIVFFDLPVTTKEERKKATAFRNNLINEGYYMIQFSVYGRLCGGMDAVNDVVKRLKNSAPPEGSIRTLVVTEKQYAQMIIIVGKKKKEEKPSEAYQLCFL